MVKVVSLNNYSVKRLNIKDSWVFEFGASGGFHLLKTFNLITKGFKGVFIESNQNKYMDLSKTLNKYPNILAINAYVEHADTLNSLDNVIKIMNTYLLNKTRPEKFRRDYKLYIKIIIYLANISILFVFNSFLSCKGKIIQLKELSTTLIISAFLIIVK